MVERIEKMQFDLLNQDYKDLDVVHEMTDMQLIAEDSSKASMVCSYGRQTSPGKLYQYCAGGVADHAAAGGGHGDGRVLPGLRKSAERAGERDAAPW